MPSDLEQIQTLKQLTLAQLVELRASPKPSYQIDGQRVSWSTYLKHLQDAVDWCDRKLAAYEPFEEASQGVT